MHLLITFACCCTAWVYTVSGWSADDIPAACIRSVDDELDAIIGVLWKLRQLCNPPVSTEGLLQRLEAKATSCEEKIADIIHLDEAEILNVQKSWLDETYKVLIFHLDPPEERALMDSARRADLWRDNLENRLVSYLGSQEAACRGDKQLWQDRQAAIAKHMLSDVCSVLDYMAAAALKLSWEYCFASKHAREVALRLVKFPLFDLADAGLPVAKYLVKCCVLAARHTSTHSFAPKLAAAKGTDCLLFELLSLSTKGPSKCALDIQFMSWLESVLTCRRAMKSFVSRMPPPDREVPQHLPSDWPAVLYDSYIRGSKIARRCSRHDFETMCVCLSIFPPSSPERDCLVQTQRIANRLLFCQPMATRCKCADECMRNKQSVMTIVKNFFISTLT